MDPVFAGDTKKRDEGKYSDRSKKVGNCIKLTADPFISDVSGADREEPVANTIEVEEDGEYDSDATLRPSTESSTCPYITGLGLTHSFFHPGSPARSASDHADDELSDTSDQYEGHKSVKLGFGNQQQGK